MNQVEKRLQQQQHKKGELNGLARNQKQTSKQDINLKNQVSNKTKSKPKHTLIKEDIEEKGRTFRRKKKSKSKQN